MLAYIPAPWILWVGIFYPQIYGDLDLPSTMDCGLIMEETSTNTYWQQLAYPPVIKHSNGKSSIHIGFNGIEWEKHLWIGDFPLLCLVTGGLGLLKMGTSHLPRVWFHGRQAFGWILLDHLVPTNCGDGAIRSDKKCQSAECSPRISPLFSHTF